MTAGKNKKDSIRKAMYFNDDAIVEDKSKKEFVRVNVRLSGEVAAYIDEEAKRTGNTMSGMCGLAITDWADQRRSHDYKAIKALESSPSYAAAQALVSAIAESNISPEKLLALAESLKK